ncbi:MAG: hypothetical protein K2O58_11065, partial [Bacteroidales bacterium]|nr:hypothetical protein [Bacteroidales bacterium]
MKRNFLISVIYAAVLAVLSSCSGKFEVGNDVDSSLYLLKYGKCEVTVYPDSREHRIYVCKGG